MNRSIQALLTVVLVLAVSVGAERAFCVTYPASTPSGSQDETMETARPQHPFLFFRGVDLPRLREEARTTHKRYLDDLKLWAKGYLDQDPIAPQDLPTNRDTLQIYYENGASYLLNVSLLYVLTEEPAYFDAARRWLSIFCLYPSETDGGYFVGAYAVALAVPYDMLYPHLEEDERATVRAHLAAVVERGVRGIESDWWAGLSLHHDQWLPVTGLGVGAVAIHGEVAGSDMWLRRVLAEFHRDVSAVGQDGAWTEGAAQWVYAMTLTLPFCHAYRSLTGEDLFELPLLKNGASYRLYNWLPVDRYIPHHDSFSHGRYNVLGAASCHVLRKLATEYDDGHAQWLAEREEERDVQRGRPPEPHPDWRVSKAHIVPMHHCVGWNFLWYDASVAPQHPSDLPLEEYFPNQGLVILRSGWTMPDTVLVFSCAPPGGHAGRAAVLAGDERAGRGVSHVHAQANSFDLYSGGNYLAISPGYGDGTSAAHSTLTINGADQRRDARFAGHILRSDFQPDYGYVVGDATECYPEEAGLDRWRRHVVYVRPDVVLIWDELIGSKPFGGDGPTIWRMDFDPQVNEAEIDAKSQTVRIMPRDDAPERASMAVSFLTPGGLQLSSELVRQQGAWVRCGQVRAHLPQGTGPEASIVTALVVERPGDEATPRVELVEGRGLIGAVVEGQRGARCLLVQAGRAPADMPLSAKIRTADRTGVCHIFGLSESAGYDVVHSAVAEEDGLYRVEISPGASLRTNESGTLTFDLNS